MSKQAQSPCLRRPSSRLQWAWAVALEQDSPERFPWEQPKLAWVRAGSCSPLRSLPPDPRRHLRRRIPGLLLLLRRKQLRLNPCGLAWHQLSCGHRGKSGPFRFCRWPVPNGGHCRNQYEQSRLVRRSCGNSQRRRLSGQARYCEFSWRPRRGNKGRWPGQPCAGFSWPRCGPPASGRHWFWANDSRR